MKLTFIITLILLGIFVIFQTYIALSTTNTEKQPYTIIRKEKDFEIRFYPSVTYATINSPAKSYEALANNGFRKLANYIFGGNQEAKQIAMTAPVHMDINDSLSTMSFVMPATYNKSTLPLPNDTGVQIKSSSDEYVAAISFGGFASDNEIKTYSEKLKKALTEKSIPFIGNVRYLGYNPPYQLFARRNELIIQINYEK
jgi:hypothetical protein